MIRGLLVANRGEIACRVMRTAQRMGIRTVAVYSEPDRDAVFVSMADEAIAIGGAAPAESYLDISAVLAAAERSGADAVHPGYGFLSENAEFARSVANAGLIWVGPPPEAIEVMGSKLASKELVGDAGVPTLPSIEVGDGDPSDAAAEIGYPLLVKASAGGGGKGMRIVSDPSELAGAVAGAAREAASAFGDGTVFLEKYLNGPRHIEIQVFSDHTGRTAALFERECSVQRRHQKIIEEAPSPVVSPSTREAMSAAAIDAAEAVDYRGAGTVEFLFQDGEFWFLEMNTRLQVEHPVTEAITGLDLVELQLLTAAGRDLPGEAWAPEIDGHAIEARLYAEDAANGFLPVTGTIDRFRIPATVRTDTGVSDGSTISVHYDPMIAKVIAHGPDRRTAIRTLSDALRRSVLSGTVTNRDLLVGILEHPDFLDDGVDTGFLDRHPVTDLIESASDERELRVAATVAALDRSIRRRDSAPVLRTLPSGWRNNPSGMQRTEFTTGRGRRVTVEYRAVGTGRFEVGSVPAAVGYEPATGDRPARLEMDDRVTHPTVEWTRSTAHVVTSRGAFDLTEVPRFPDAAVDIDPGSLTSPMPGKILEVLVADGDVVTAGDPLIVMEAMKMEHTLRSPVDGTVTSVSVAVGDQVEGDVTLAVVREEEGR